MLARGGSSLSDEREDVTDVVVRVNEGVRVLSSGRRYAELSRPRRGVLGAGVYNECPMISPSPEAVEWGLTLASDLRLTS